MPRKTLPKGRVFSSQYRQIFEICLRHPARRNAPPPRRRRGDQNALFRTTEPEHDDRAATVYWDDNGEFSTLL